MEGRSVGGVRLRAVQSVGVMCGVVVVVVGVSVRELLSGHDFANFGWGFGDNCWMVLLIVWWLLGGSEHFFLLEGGWCADCGVPNRVC